MPTLRQAQGERVICSVLPYIKYGNTAPPPEGSINRAYPVNTQFKNGGLFLGRKWCDSHICGFIYGMAASVFCKIVLPVGCDACCGR